jgi:hypothetical protein
MNELRFSDGDNYVQLGVAFEDDGDVPEDRPVYVSLVLESAGFRGHNHLCVAREALQAFCRNLIQLEASRAGEAVLESPSPGELYLKVCSISTAGHLAAVGCARYLGHPGYIDIEHKLQFGFVFDPAQLMQAVRLPWVRHYATQRPS